MKVLFILLFSIIDFIPKNNLNTIKAEIKLLDKQKDRITLELKLINDGNFPILVYKPTKDDLCSSLIDVNFSGINKSDSFEWYPCEYVIDLSRIDISIGNSILLGENESFTKEFTILFNDITPFLQGDKFELCFHLNYDLVFFNHKTEYQTLKYKVTSNTIKLEK